MKNNTNTEAENLDPTQDGGGSNSSDLLVCAEDQSDTTSAICPYCKTECFQPEGEDYSEDDQEEECDECGKKFYLNQSFTVDHNTRGDCELNGESHDYRPAKYQQEMEVCAKCGECRLIKDED